MLNNTKQQSAYIFYSIIVIIVLRFILTGLIPLLDKTESRYAEIARLMYETKDWVVLQIDYGVPFWAKPPLSTWMSAASYEVFGVNEIAARLPYYLICLALVFILGKFVKQAGKSFYLPAFILLTTPEFLLHAGVVSTDAALCLSITLIMISFWKSITNETRSFWNYLFFIALGLGLLSKGPLVLVLTAPPIFIWLIIQKISIKEVWNKIPWLIGILITIVIGGFASHSEKETLFEKTELPPYVIFAESMRVKA
jgi:4-amino-4-deoxy-L-arabinose transferase-like glycosyltransferase